MAQAILNPAIGAIDSKSLLYDLYTRFYDGMTKNNNTDAPDYMSNPPYEKNEDGSDKVDEDGAKVVDQAKISEGLQQYSTIMTKNTAYMLANAIVSTISPGGGTGSGGGGTGFVARSGDSMQGLLGALYGFEAGYNNKKIFETIVNADEDSVAIITGNLQVSDDVTIKGRANLSNSGIWFGGNQSIWYDQTTLKLVGQDIGLQGAVEIDGTVKLADIAISSDGIFFGKHEYYHSGNSNMDSVDWTMQNAIVHGTLSVIGTSQFTDLVSINGGFQFSLLGQRLMYTDVVVHDDLEGNEQTKEAFIVLNSDLSLINNHGIKFNDNYIVWVRNTDNVVSFSAPGAVMNLGDKGTDEAGNGLPTKYISIQADIKNYNGTHTLVSHDGTGNFPNGFSTGAANSLTASFQTYYANSNDYGVVVNDNMRFGGIDGVNIHGNKDKLTVEVPYSIVANEVPKLGVVGLNIRSVQTSSLVYNPTSDPLFLALQMATDAKHFAFSAPLEASCYAIKSDRYKTRLEEDALFFDDGKFIEGIESGLRLSQNTLFDGNLYSFNPNSSSISFSSGFAGSGWAIMEDVTVGGVHATFDSLTIRKKMRVYELEVQKLSTTNGSLWVSDSCSGDEVRVLD